MKYKILFARHGIFECFSPPCGRIKAEIFAWLYRMKGEGRDAVVVDDKPGKVIRCVMKWNNKQP